MNSELMRTLFPKRMIWHLKQYSKSLYNLACIPANALRGFADELNKK